MKKIAIIGGGVAGLSAAIYALRSGAEVTLFEQFGLGGLVATIDKIENFPSYSSVEGWKLASDMSAQAKALGLKTVRQRVVSLQKRQNEFHVVTDKGEYEFPAVVVATGTSHNKLGIEGEFVGHGVSYCATCDGAFFRNLPVAVVGGGRVAVSEASYLSEICGKVYVITSQEELTGPKGGGNPSCALQRRTPLQHDRFANYGRRRSGGDRGFRQRQKNSFGRRRAVCGNGSCARNGFHQRRGRCKVARLSCGGRQMRNKRKGFVCGGGRYRRQSQTDRNSLLRRRKGRIVCRGILGNGKIKSNKSKIISAY